MFHGRNYAPQLYFKVLSSPQLFHLGPQHGSQGPPKTLQRAPFTFEIKQKLHVLTFKTTQTYSCIPQKLISKSHTHRSIQSPALNKKMFLPTLGTLHICLECFPPRSSLVSLPFYSNLCSDVKFKCQVPRADFLNHHSKVIRQVTFTGVQNIAQKYRISTSLAGECGKK